MPDRMPSVPYDIKDQGAAMATTVSTSMGRWAVCTAVVFGAIAAGTGASAESPDGWKPDGAEIRVFQANRDDGRLVGVHVRPAVNGRDKGVLLRVTLSGFKDKSLAFRSSDLPELLANYDDKSPRGSWPGFKWPVRPWPRPSLDPFCQEFQKVVEHAGEFEISLIDMSADVLSARACVVVLSEHAKRIVATARSVDNVARRFQRAHGQTVENAPIEVRGAVVRAYHSALIGSGAK